MNTPLTHWQRVLVERLGVELRANASRPAIGAAISKALRDRTAQVLQANPALQVGKYVVYKGRVYKFTQFRVADSKAQLVPRGGGPMKWVMIIDLEHATEAPAE